MNNHYSHLPTMLTEKLFRLPRMFGPVALLSNKKQGPAYAAKELEIFRDLKLKGNYTEYYLIINEQAGTCISCEGT
jgi:hypothetical protein